LDLAAALGVEFEDPELARLALVHRSYAFENALSETNERLEFLGDAVLGVVVTDVAYRAFPSLSEGDLAKLRSSTVNMHALAEVARELGLGDLVLLGRGEEMSGGREKTSILADALEAVLGAVYLDRGPDTAFDLIERLFFPRMVAYMSGDGGRDFKTTLQEMAAQEKGMLPDYRVSERGPDHQKEFTATVFLDGEPWGQGQGRSKKEAEQQAAQQACDKLATRHPAKQGG
jgi:ribonuclease-3